jgi:hypothetical protein
VNPFHCTPRLVTSLNGLPALTRGYQTSEVLDFFLTRETNPTDPFIGFRDLDRRCLSIEEFLIYFFLDVRTSRACRFCYLGHYSSLQWGMTIIDVRDRIAELINRRVNQPKRVQSNASAFYVFTMQFLSTNSRISSLTMKKQKLILSRHSDKIIQQRTTHRIHNSP